MDIFIILLTLVLSAFFSGMEIAFISANRIFLEIEKKRQDIFARLLSRITEKPSQFIATMLVGNNIALVIYGLVMGDLLFNWFSSSLPLSYPWQFLQPALTDFRLLTQTLLSTLLILITAEFLPKVFFQIYSNKLLVILSPITYFFYQLLYPISKSIIWISDKVLSRFFKTEGDQIQLAFTKVELGDYINEQMGTLQDGEQLDSEIHLFQNALEFSEVKAREIMIPRTEITSLEVRESPNTLSKLFTETGYSKILVYQDSIDDIIGYVHSFELFKKPKAIRNILLPVEYVPETMPIQSVLNILIKKRKSLAVVVDEYGGTAGMITVEDIVEELFGEIEDEHDTMQLVEQKLSADEYLFSARLEIDYLNEEYDLEIPEDEAYSTLGGFITSHAEEIPKKGDKVSIGNFQFSIEQATANKIETVRLFLISDI